MSLGFENIFQKYNITCEAPQKRKKYYKSEKPHSSKRKYENQKKNASNKNSTCLQIGIAHKDPTQENQHTQFDINKNNLSSSPSFCLNEANIDTNNVPEGKECQRNKNDKMWQLMKSTRLSLLHYNSLNEGETKKSNNKINNTNETQLPRISSFTHEKVSRTNIKYEIQEDSDKLQNDSTGQETLLVNRTIGKNNKTELNSSLCLNRSTNADCKPKSQHLNLNRHYQGMANKSILGKSNSFNLKKKKQNSLNSTQKNRSRFKPLDVTITQKSMTILNTTTTENQKTKNISSSKNLSSYRPSDDLDISFSSSSSSSDEDESFHPFISSSPKPSQVIDTPTTSSQKSADQPTELDLLLELIEQNDKKKAPKNKTNSQYVSSPKKSSLKGGYEELFLRALERVKISGRYLKHDKKFGFKNGIPLKVVKLETSYNVNVATVECMEYNNVFCIVIAPEMATQIKSGTIIEAFFNDATVPYKLQTKEGNLDFFLEPYKLLVV